MILLTLYPIITSSMYETAIRYVEIGHPVAVSIPKRDPLFGIREDVWTAAIAFLAVAFLAQFA